MAERNAIESWLQLAGDCDIIVFSDQENLSYTSPRIRVSATFRKDDSGLPYLNELFERASIMSTNNLMCYCNSDIILCKPIVAKLLLIKKIKSPFLAVSQRIDLNVPFAVDFTDPTELERLAGLSKAEGLVHPPYGSDLFVFPRGQYTTSTMPDLVVGRPGWDNWMIYDARKRFNKLINLQAEREVIHQNHAERYNGKDPKFQVNYHFLPPNDWYTFILCYCNNAVQENQIIRTPFRTNLKDSNEWKVQRQVSWESIFNNHRLSYYMRKLGIEKVYKKIRQFASQILK
jgi:hypothetical protein